MSRSSISAWALTEKPSSSSRRSTSIARRPRRWPREAKLGSFRLRRRCGGRSCDLSDRCSTTARANATTYSVDGSPASPPLPSPPALAQSAIPTTAAGQQDLLFTERALTLFLTSHRLNDMRRLIWQYGRNAESVFPRGPYEPDNTSKAGANYGTDVNLPIPSEESNNPLFLKGPAACINRSAGIS